MANTTTIETDDLLIKHQRQQPYKHKTTLFSLLIQPFQWVHSLSTQLTPSFIAGVFLVYGLNLGFAGHYFRVVSDYYWKDVQKLRPSSAQFYVGFYYIPWILKPIWGLLTDVVPIWGYRRRPYFVIAGIVGTLSVVVIVAERDIPASIALLCMIGGTLSMAIASVVIDACIAKNSIEMKEVAADLQSLGGLCSSLGALVGFSSSGFLVHWLGAQGAFALLAIPSASVLILGFFIYEVRITSTTQFAEKKALERVSGAVENLHNTIKIPQVWKPALFMFLTLALSYSTHEGHFYWYTDAKDGPGFSQEFVGMIYAVGSVGSIFGVLVYHKFLKDCSFRKVLFSAQLLYAISGMFDLLFILRWNKALGIPDSFFIIMEESVLHIITRVRWLPMVVLNTRLCPLGIEGTFFALLMGIDSVGSLSSKMFGGFMLRWLHVSRTDFSNLWLAVLLRNCLRFSTLALVFLVPNATQHDVLVPPEFQTKHSDDIHSEKEAALQLVPLTEKFEL